MSARTAAFFDLDKTIIATSSTSAFSRPFFNDGLVTPTSVVRSAYAHLLYMTGGADATQTERMRKEISELVTGWEVARVTAIVADTIHQYIEPYIYAEAARLIEQHHAEGRDVVIVSASGSELVEPIAAALGADHAISTRMHVVDGKYTGEIDFYNYGDNKAVAIRELAAERGYDLSRSYAYSDSVTDAPMLDAVGFGFAVNPDKALRKLAQERGWGVLTFENPVSLWNRIPREVPVVAGGLLLVTAIVIAVTIAVRIKRRRREP